MAWRINDTVFCNSLKYLCGATSKKKTVLDHLGIILHPLGLKFVLVEIPLAKFRKFWPSQAQKEYKYWQQYYSGFNFWWIIRSRIWYHQGGDRLLILYNICFLIIVQWLKIIILWLFKFDIKPGKARPDLRFCYLAYKHEKGKTYNKIVR